MVRVTPNGQVSFPSDLWGGQVFDKQITKESRALDLFDNVMVDHGLDISKIVPDGMTVNMPPFLAGQEQMTAAQVERAIGRIKTYHILDGTLPNTLSPYPTQIAVVCGLLTNFFPAKEPLCVLVSESNLFLVSVTWECHI